MCTLLHPRSASSIIPISCDYDGFKFFWSCPTFWKNFCFPLIIFFFRIILGFTSCASVLVISLQKDNPFSAFTFISSVVTISSFTSASASCMIAFIWCLFSFFFSNQASSLFLLAFSYLLGLFRYSELELLRKKSSFLLNICIDFSSSLVQSVFHFFDKGITNFVVFEMSREVRYHFSVNFHEAFLILFRAFYL